MAYPISSSVVEEAYKTINNDLKQLQAACQAVQTATAGGAAAPAWYALNVALGCIAYRTDYGIISSNSALVAQLVPYVQSQVAGATALSVQTEYSNLNTLAGNLLNAAAAEYPHDAQGRLLDRTFSLTTGLNWINFTAAQAPTFMSAVAALLAAFA